MQTKGANICLSLLLDKLIQLKHPSRITTDARRLCVKSDGGSDNWSLTTVGLMGIVVANDWFAAFEWNRNLRGHTHDKVRFGYTHCMLMA